MNIKPTLNERTFSETELLVSKTDLKGVITYTNRNFIKIVGLDETQMIGKPHNIIRHPDMPKIIFKYLWNYLQDGKEIHAYVKNLCADGSFYWVMANVTPSFDPNTNKIIAYHSARRKPCPEAMQVIKPLYEQLLAAEKQGGITASEKIINDLLKEKGVAYDEFILSF
jgi:PAS domain S-box-containing protein